MMTDTITLYLQDMQLTSGFEQTLTHSNIWERSHSKPYETTFEEELEQRDYMLNGVSSLVNVEKHVFQGEERTINGKKMLVKTIANSSEVRIQTTKQTAKAKPVFYVEDGYSPKNEELSKLGYRNAREIAEERSLRVTDMLSKLTYHANRQTNIIIFILDETKCYKSTWNAIFNAIVNNKSVIVRIGKATFRNVKYGTKAFATLSNMFWNLHRENKMKIAERRIMENKSIRLSELPYTTLSLNRVIVANLITNLWELDNITSDTDAKVVTETFTAYLKGHLESTRAIGITVREHQNGVYTEDEYTYQMRKTSGDELLDNIIALPLEIQEILIPLLTIEVREVESFGNEDYFSSQVDEYEDYAY